MCIFGKCSSWDYVKMTRDIPLFMVWGTWFAHYKSIGFTLPKHEQSSLPLSLLMRNREDYQLLNVFQLLFLITYSSNAPSQKIRKNGKKKRFWGTWISRERQQEHYNLVRFHSFSALTQIWWELQGFRIKKIHNKGQQSF